MEERKLRSDLCLQCLECCQKFRLPVNKFITQRDRDLYKARGFELARIHGVQFLVFPHICPQLTPEGCKIYDTRPDACKMYNGLRDPVVDCKWKELE